jgi:ubiquinone/menaquinone biosynthesis C-methylase UbiE
MLAVASARLAAAADHPARALELAQGEARAMPVAADRFDFALVGGSGSFNHLTDEQVGQALRELGRVLRPDGGLGLELVNPYLLVELEPLRTFGPLRPFLADGHVERSVSMRHDPVACTVQIRQVTQYASAGQHVEFEDSFCLQLWTPEDIGDKLERAGFRSSAFYGGHDLETFGRWSPDLLVLAK